MAWRLLRASTFRAADSFLRISVPHHRGFFTIMEGLKYSDRHQWARVNGNIATIGRAFPGILEVRDRIRYIGLPEVGDEVSRGSVFAEYETVVLHSLGEFYSPVSGKVVEVNEKVLWLPSLMSFSPYKIAWLMKVEMKDASELEKLMDAESYSEFSGVPIRDSKSLGFPTKPRRGLCCIPHCYTPRWENQTETRCVCECCAEF